jgi:hypothetical protein
MSRKDTPPRGQSAPAGFESQPDSAISRPVRVAITAFIAFNLFAIVSWCVPLESPLIARCRDLSLPYLRWTGLFQKWDMFAPDPSKLNNYVSAVILYRNGSSSLWSFPRMENLGLFEKYVKERYRKYANDNLRLDGYSAAWPDAARYIARASNNRPSNPPIAVALMRVWSVVPPPDPQGKEAAATWNQYAFFRYDVAPGDLR